MKNTIKKQMLTAVRRSKKGLTRQDLLNVIHKAKGGKGEHNYSEGHYSTNFASMVNREGLLRRPKKNCYKITKLGVMYLDNPIKFKMRRTVELLARYRQLADDRLNKIYELRRKLTEKQREIEELEKGSDQSEKIKGLEEVLTNCHRTIFNQDEEIESLKEALRVTHNLATNRGEEIEELKEANVSIDMHKNTPLSTEKYNVKNQLHEMMKEIVDNDEFLTSDMLVIVIHKAMELRRSDF
jgi:hypothetical protein